MTQPSFSVVYDGEALRSHSMDVRDLAPALLALGQMFDEANRVLNGDKTSVKLQVTAHKEGSFEIALALFQSFGSQVTGFLSGSFVTSVINLEVLLVGTFGSGYSLFRLIRWLKGGKPDEIAHQPDGTIRITKDEVSIDIPLELLRLYQDVGVRQAVENVLKPLEKEGINSFEVKKQSKIIEMVNKDELHYYALPELQDEIIRQHEMTSAYSIVSLAFKDDNKWRLYDGSGTISVSIKDEEFLRKVEQNLISFTKHDILLCRVQMTQYRTDTGLRTEYELLEVLEHHPAARQLKLFDDD